MQHVKSIGKNDDVTVKFITFTFLDDTSPIRMAAIKFINMCMYRLDSTHTTT